MPLTRKGEALKKSFNTRIDELLNSIQICKD